MMKVRIEATGASLATPDAVRLLKSQAKRDNDRQTLAIAAAVEHLGELGARIETSRSSSGMVDFHVTGRPMLVRVGFPDPKHKEFGMGLFRFKVTPKPGDGFTMFAMFAPHGSLRLLATYVLSWTELGDMKSLNLRFDNFARASKWDYARDRWPLTSNAGRPSGRKK
jgi:hypothetical protein